MKESRQNTAKNTYAPNPVSRTSGGVIRPIIKLLIQSRLLAGLHIWGYDLLEHVEMATPFARRLDGNTSDGIAHGTGPQEAPKASM